MNTSLMSSDQWASASAQRQARLESLQARVQSALDLTSSVSEDPVHSPPKPARRLVTTRERRLAREQALRTAHLKSKNTPRSDTGERRPLVSQDAADALAPARLPTQIPQVDDEDSLHTIDKSNLRPNTYELVVQRFQRGRLDLGREQGSSRHRTTYAEVSSRPDSARLWPLGSGQFAPTQTDQLMRRRANQNVDGPQYRRPRPLPFISRQVAPETMPDLSGPDTQVDEAWKVAEAYDSVLESPDKEISPGKSLERIDTFGSPLVTDHHLSSSLTDPRSSSGFGRSTNQQQGSHIVPLDRDHANPWRWLRSKGIDKVVYQTLSRQYPYRQLDHVIDMNDEDPTQFSVQRSSQRPQSLRSPDPSPRPEVRPPASRWHSKNDSRMANKRATTGHNAMRSGHEENTPMPLDDSGFSFVSNSLNVVADSILDFTDDNADLEKSPPWQYGKFGPRASGAPTQFIPFTRFVEGSKFCEHNQRALSDPYHSQKAVHITKPVKLCRRWTHRDPARTLHVVGEVQSLDIPKGVLDVSAAYRSHIKGDKDWVVARILIDQKQVWESPVMKPGIRKAYPFDLRVQGKFQTTIDFVFEAASPAITPESEVLLSARVLAQPSSVVAESRVRLLYNQRGMGNVSMHELTNALMVCCREGRLQLGLDLFTRIQQIHGDVGISVDIYNALIECAIASARHSTAQELYRKVMADTGTLTNLVTYRAMLKGCTRMGDTAGALKLASDMDKLGIKKSLAVYNLLLEAGSGWRALDYFEQLFLDMKDDGLVPNTSSFNHVIGCMRKEGDDDECLRWYDRMRRAGIAPDGDTFLHLILVLTAKGRIDDAFDLMRRGERTGIEMRFEAYYALLVACLRSGDRQQAMRLLTYMRNSGRKIPGFIYEPLIKDARERVGNPRLALEVYREALAESLMGITVSDPRANMSKDKTKSDMESGLEGDLVQRRAHVTDHDAPG